MHATRRPLKFFGCSRLACELCGQSAQSVYRAACTHCRLGACVCSSVLAAHRLASAESARSPAGSAPGLRPLCSTRLPGALQQALASGIRRPNPRLQSLGVLLCADPAARYLQRPRGTARRGIIDEDRQFYNRCGLGDAYSPELRSHPPRLQAPRSRGLRQGDTTHRSPARLLAA